MAAGESTGLARTGSNRGHVCETFRRLCDRQNEEVPGSGLLSFVHGAHTRAQLRPLDRTALDDPREIARLARWREAAQDGFPSQFQVTLEGTRRWLEKGVLATEDRLLFMVEVLTSGEPLAVGHVGLFRVNETGSSCEIDNIVRGEPEAPGIIQSAIAMMLDWKFTELGMNCSYLRVFSDNERGIRLYERLGYREIQRTPLRCEEEPGVKRWVEVRDDPYVEIRRYFVTMRLTRDEWRNRATARDSALP